MAVDVPGGPVYATRTGASGIRNPGIQFTPPTVWRAVRAAMAEVYVRRVLEAARARIS